MTTGMLKCEFYIITKKSEKGKKWQDLIEKARKVSGWADGECYYYHGSEHWSSVDPETGRMITTGETRKECQQKTKDLAEKLKAIRSTISYNRKKEQFEWLVKEAMIEDI